MTVDRVEMIRQLLALAEQHVAEGDKTLARQRGVLAELRANGQDIVEAEKILQSSEELPLRHLAERERLRQELAQISGSQA